jgi:hypothetical protein
MFGSHYDPRFVPSVKTWAADAGFAGVGSLRLLGEGDPIEVVMAAERPDFEREWS